MTATRDRGWRLPIGICVGLFGGWLTAMTIAQTPQTSPSPGTVLDLPAGAKTLEGIPRVQVETTENTTTRRVLEPADAARKHLTIRLDDGRYFWGRDSRPLNVVTSGGYIYLSSAEPGKYIRLRRINDRLTYVEHVDMGLRSETYWGELRIVLGR